ncbi:MAG: hypothetical protein Q9179_004154 [Wetmoreana sp. 5 TL-2023]
MGAPTSTPWNTMAMKLADPKLAWYYAQFDPLVEIAQVGPGSSILDLGCGNAVVALVAKAIAGSGDHPVVGIDNSQGMLQAPQQPWENQERNRDIPNMIRLYHGDIRDLDAIGEILGDLGSKLRFDHIFARNVISSPDSEWIATLQHWAKYKILGAGKITLTCGLADLAGMLLVNKDGKTVQRWHLMIEAEWVRGEEVLREFITCAGLQLQDIQRVGFQGEDSGAWQEVGQDYELHARTRHTQVGAEGGLEPEWSNADGSFSTAFNLQLKMSRSSRTWWGWSSDLWLRKRRDFSTYMPNLSYTKTRPLATYHNVAFRRKRVELIEHH